MDKALVIIPTYNEVENIEIIVKSMVELDGKTYRSRDQGWKDGQVVWGDDVIYEFDKL